LHTEGPDVNFGAFIALAENHLWRRIKPEKMHCRNTRQKNKAYGEPQKVFSSSLTWKVLLNPKSMILMFLFSSSRRFSGLRSRWMTEFCGGAQSVGLCRLKRKRISCLQSGSSPVQTRFVGKSGVPPYPSHACEQRCSRTVHRPQRIPSQ